MVTKEEGRNCDKHVGGEWSNQTNKREEEEEGREGDVFRWKRKYSSPPLATFSRSRLLRRFFACHFLDPVSFFSLPSLQFFIPPFSTSCTNPRLLFPRCFELHPSRSSLSWKETKLASPKARLIQVRGRDRALPFYGPSRNRCFERFYRSLHTNIENLAIYPSARQRRFDHSLRQCLPRVFRIYLYAHRDKPLSKNSSLRD